MIIKKPLLSLIEQLINAYLSLDPYAATLRLPLANKTIALIIPELPFPLCFSFYPEKIQVSADIHSATVSIRGSLINLLRLHSMTNKTQLMSEGKIVIEGDIELASAFQSFWSRLYIDWEGLLATVIGDPLALFLGRGSRLIKQTLCQAQDSLTQTLGEYLQEELALLPPKMAVHDLVSDIHTLRLRTDRLSERIHRLEAIL